MRLAASWCRVSVTVVSAGAEERDVHVASAWHRPVDVAEQPWPTKLRTVKRPEGRAPAQILAVSMCGGEPSPLPSPFSKGRGESFGGTVFRSPNSDPSRVRSTCLSPLGAGGEDPGERRFRLHTYSLVGVPGCRQHAEQTRCRPCLLECSACRRFSAAASQRQIFPCKTFRRRCRWQ